MPVAGTTSSNCKTHRTLLRLACLALLAFGSGCSLVPDIKHKPQLINPFPQLRTIAVLPFSNQSEEPTLSGERVALAYNNELQAIRGFEVLPLGVVKAKLREFRPQDNWSGADFQEFAQMLGVDAILLGSVTDYDPYYPPRMSMKVNWYAANPGFHPVQPGYGLPWGTTGEKEIPKWVHYEAQRALAAEQLKTQTPDPTSVAILPEDRSAPSMQLIPSGMPNGPSLRDSERALPGDGSTSPEVLPIPEPVSPASATMVLEGEGWMDEANSLPCDWPDPRGFIPDAPTLNRPNYVPQHEPIISHMRNFNGHDEEFTEQLAEYFYYRDDARFGGWQAYLQRSEDFIRFCCYLHLSETLISRGGQDESRLILRWPIDRYTR